MVECIEDYRLQLLKLAEVGTTADLSDIEETEGEAVVLLVLGQVGEELLDHGHGLLLAVRHEAGHTLGNVDWPGLVNVASPGCMGWAGRSGRGRRPRRDIVLKNSSMADSALAPQERRQGQLDYLG